VVSMYLFDTRSLKDVNGTTTAAFLAATSPSVRSVSRYPQGVVWHHLPHTASMPGISLYVNGIPPGSFTNTGIGRSHECQCSTCSVSMKYLRGGGGSREYCRKGRAWSEEPRARECRHESWQIASCILRSRCHPHHSDKKYIQGIRGPLATCLWSTKKDMRFALYLLKLKNI
jgi:hypothetical protein